MSPQAEMEIDYIPGTGWMTRWALKLYREITESKSVQLGSNVIYYSLKKRLMNV